MNPRLFAILLILVGRTFAFSQITTTTKERCNIYPDSSLRHKIYTLNRHDSVRVNGYHLITETYRVSRDTVEGYVHSKKLKNNPGLSEMRWKAYASGRKELTKSRPKNNISVNMFGDASTASFSYERLVFLNPNIFLAGKLGLGFRYEYEAYLHGDSFVTMPYHVTLNFGVKKHFVEFGVGWTTDLAGAEHNYHENQTFRYVIVGYRFQSTISNLRVERKGFFRINLIYTSSADAIRGIVPFGVSFGKSF